MNNEESRLRTFSMWPSDAAVDASRIAKAGFYYTGQGLEVQCFSCGGKISEWNYGDQVMAKHRRLDPNCPFVLNPSTSGNVPKLQTSTPASQLPPTNSTSPSVSVTVNNQESPYRTEQSRLETFSNWPAGEIVTPENLAKAGFYSLQEDDKVKCAYCNGIAGYWEPGDDPREEHRRHFPHCMFVLSNFNSDAIPVDNDNTRNRIRNSSMNNSKLVSAENLHELGIQAHKGPRQPRYATLESRLRTFSNWSEDLIQTPSMLAEAGFFYVGTGDQVRCFHCDGGLRHWDPEDEPWVEHARWFPACPYVRLVKGQQFIQSCNPQQLPHNNLIPTVMRNVSVFPSNSSRTTTRPNRELSDQEMHVFMNSPVAIAALSIGLPACRVKQAIRQKILETGSSFISADALIEATFNLQIEDTEVPSENIQQEVSNILNAVIRQTSKECDNNAISKKPPVNKDETNTDTQCSSEREPVPKLSLEEENRQLKEARLCKICMDNEIGVVFLPCGHLTTCVNCAPSLKDCPVCRSVIKGTVRTFLS